jgi:hypothetical protein
VKRTDAIKLAELGASLGLTGATDDSLDHIYRKYWRVHEEKPVPTKTVCICKCYTQDRHSTI